MREQFPYAYEVTNIITSQWLLSLIFDHFSINTLKLWLPQLFQAINDYEYDHDGVSSSMCEMLDSGLRLTNSTSQICEVVRYSFNSQ